MNNVWLMRHKTNTIQKFLENNGAHHLRNCSTFYHNKSFRLFYDGVVELLGFMGYPPNEESWLLTDNDTANILTGTWMWPASPKTEFVGLVNGIWWLFTDPNVKTKKLNMTTILVGGSLRKDGSAQSIGALELT